MVFILASIGIGFAYNSNMESHSVSVSGGWFSGNIFYRLMTRERVCCDCDMQLAVIVGGRVGCVGLGAGKWAGSTRILVHLILSLERGSDPRF